MLIIMTFNKFKENGQSFMQKEINLDIKMVADEIGHWSVVKIENNAKLNPMKWMDYFILFKERITLRIIPLAKN